MTWGEIAHKFREMRCLADGVSLAADWLDGVDFVDYGTLNDRVVGAVRRPRSHRTLYFLWWPGRHQPALRVWDVEENIPVDGGSLRAMWDSWPYERIVEEFDRR